MRLSYHPITQNHSFCLCLLVCLQTNKHSLHTHNLSSAEGQVTSQFPSQPLDPDLASVPGRALETSCGHANVHASTHQTHQTVSAHQLVEEPKTQKRIRRTRMRASSLAPSIGMWYAPSRPSPSSSSLSSLQRILTTWSQHYCQQCAKKESISFL